MPKQRVVKRKRVRILKTKVRVKGRPDKVVVHREKIPG